MRERTPLAIIRGIILRYCLITLFVILAIPAAAARGIYQQPAEFINDIHGGSPPKPKVIWITKALRKDVRTILGHDLSALRVRYWEQNSRTSWILEDVGKEEPITVGIVVHRNVVETIKVLIYRESRGSEVRYPFFTDQFQGAQLGANKRLDRHIDGISGATLSVRALTKLARLALFLHEHLGAKHASP